MRARLRLLAAALFSLPALAQASTCGSDLISNVSVKWCTLNGAAFDHTKVLWVFHGAGGSEHTWIDSASYQRIRAIWVAEGILPPVTITVSFGEKWTLTDMPSQYVAGGPKLFPLMLNQVIPKLETKLVGNRSLILKRWMLGYSMGGYNVAQILTKDVNYPYPAIDHFVLGCPGLFTITPFADDDTRNAYVDRNSGAARLTVDSGLDILGRDELTGGTVEDWNRNDPLQRIASMWMPAVPPAVFVWWNTTDAYGFKEGAQRMATFAAAMGLPTTSYSNDGGHCLVDTAIETQTAAFLQ